MGLMRGVRPRRHWREAFVAVAVILALLSVWVRWLLVRDPVGHSAVAYAEFNSVARIADITTLFLQVVSFALLFGATWGQTLKRLWFYWLIVGACVLVERLVLVPIFYA